MWTEPDMMRVHYQLEIKKRQTDAKARVTQYFKRESK
jgi:hypothetical protein